MASPRFELAHITPTTIRRRQLTMEETAAIAGAAIAIGAMAGIGIYAIMRARKRRRAKMADDVIELKPER